MKKVSALKLLVALLSLCSLAILSGCIVAENEYQKLAPGVWRGTLELEAPPNQADVDILDESIPTQPEGGAYLPFLLEVSYTDDQSLQVEILNGPERTAVERIAFGWNKRIAKDTFSFYFDVYDSYLTGIAHEGVMQGKWVRNNRENYEIPFIAHYGEDHRFDEKTIPPATDLSGTWACSFEIESESPYPAIGEFDQQDHMMLGTFRTETGDYRFLEGAIYGNRFGLSVFDGAHAFLFTGKVEGDSLLGTFYSGNHYKTLWTGKQDPNATLTSPDSLTQYIGEGPIQFQFPNQEGELISLEDPKYEGKAKLIQIMGTWCPNCRDETQFLVDYLKQNPSDDLAVIALAFESYRDDAKNKRAIQAYYDYFDMNYEILLAGYRDKAEASENMPMLSSIISFPTLLFVDKLNRVRRIHTGYNGPATSKFDEFVNSFEESIQIITSD